LAAAVVCVIGVGQAWAVPIAVTNADFQTLRNAADTADLGMNGQYGVFDVSNSAGADNAEILTNGSNAFVSGATIKGWAATADADAGVNDDPDNDPNNANIFAYSNGPTIYQDLSDVLAANTTYTLNVDVRTAGAFTPTVTIALYAGGSNGSGGDVVATYSEAMSGGDPNDTVFTTKTATFTTGSSPAGLGEALNIRLSTTSSQNARFDNVVLTKDVIPEPASLVLMGLGGLLLVTRRNKLA
jgi:hypothetical protein